MTAQPLDDEMAKRIKKHRAERGEEWVTFEEPLNLTGILENVGSDPQSVLVLDCLTLWVSNLLMADNSQHFLKSLSGSTISALFFSFPNRDPGAHGFRRIDRSSIDLFSI